MKRCCATRDLVVACAVSFVLPCLVAGYPGQRPPDYTIRTDVRLVLLDVSVKSHDGGFVSGLSKENFAVFEDGQRQQITVFGHDDLPVTVGILVDESYSMKPKRAEVLAAAQTFIEASNSRDEVFVLNFNDKVSRGLPRQLLFSDSIQQLSSALNRGTPEGKTALYDAVEDGLKQLELGRRDKKALVVISDGGDNASKHTRREIVDMVERSLATVYAIGLYDIEDPDRDPAILRLLARISGGQAYFPENPSGMTSICRKIAEDIRTRYTIGYIPKTANGAPSLRHIRVHVSAPGHGRLSARTRSSYQYDDVSTQGKD